MRPLYLLEICDDGKGFIIELWKKGLLWDSILGVLWIPLATVEYATNILKKILDCRGWQREIPLQSTTCSHRATYDILSSMASGISTQESKLRYKYVAVNPEQPEIYRFYTRMTENSVPYNLKIYKLWRRTQ